MPTHDPLQRVVIPAWKADRWCARKGSYRFTASIGRLGNEDQTPQTPDIDRNASDAHMARTLATLANRRGDSQEATLYLRLAVAIDSPWVDSETTTSFWNLREGFPN